MEWYRRKPGVTVPQPDETRPPWVFFCHCVVSHVSPPEGEKNVGSLPVFRGAVEPPSLPALLPAFVPC